MQSADDLDDDDPVYPLVEHGIISAEQQAALDRGDIAGFRALEQSGEAMSAQAPGESPTPSKAFYFDLQKGGRTYEEGLEAVKYRFDSFCENVGATAQQRDDLLALGEDVADRAHAGDEDAQHFLE
jgi:hypothetical protein